jgi:large subunit ribosomal protein L4
MDIQVRSLAGAAVGTMSLDDRVFGIEPNRAVLHQAVVAQLANRRQGTADTKTRAEVAGGGRKPWRQKGTGRARQGSTRAPHWRGGGVVFGPHPRSYHQDLPRKMRRLALRSALSDKAATSNLYVVDNFSLADMRTKTLLGSLSTLGLSGQIIVVVPTPDSTIRRASGNLQNVHVALPNGLSVVELLQADAVVFVQDAVVAVTRLLVGDTTDAAATSTETNSPNPALVATADAAESEAEA